MRIFWSTRSSAPPQIQKFAVAGVSLQGVELGWLDRAEISYLIEHLSKHRDFGVE